MTYSQASRYSKIFKILSDPYTLQILDVLFENRNGYTTEKLAEEVNTSESKVTRICEELVDLNILDKDYEDGGTVFEATDSRYGNFAEKIVEIID